LPTNHVRLDLPGRIAFGLDQVDLVAIGIDRLERASGQLERLVSLFENADQRPFLDVFVHCDTNAGAGIEKEVDVLGRRDFRSELDACHRFIGKESIRSDDLEALSEQVGVIERPDDTRSDLEHAAEPQRSINGRLPVQCSGDTSATFGSLFLAFDKGLVGVLRRRILAPERFLPPDAGLGIIVVTYEVSRFVSFDEGHRATISGVVFVGVLVSVETLRRVDQLSRLIAIKLLNIRHFSKFLEIAEFC